MSSYLDSSVLTSLYAPGAHSVAAREYLLQAARPFLLTPFGEAELTNAIELRAFRREITAAQARAALARLAAHIAGSVFQAVPVPAAVYDVARQLSRRHTATLGTRTLDILHVAAALVLHTDSFYTFDRTQAQLARARWCWSSAWRTNALITAWRLTFNSAAAWSSSWSIEAVKSTFTR